MNNRIKQYVKDNDTLHLYLARNSPKQFNVVPFYSEEGDFLAMSFANIDHYAKAIAKHFDVCYPFGGSKDIVGFKLYRVKRIVQLWELHSAREPEFPRISVEKLVSAAAMYDPITDAICGSLEQFDTFLKRGANKRIFHRMMNVVDLIAAVQPTPLITIRRK
jgi:hypothetical protein